MTFAIDLLWIRPGKVGGTEAYTRNLLDGFQELEEDYKIIMITSKDNAASFKSYLKDGRFDMIIADIYSATIFKRIVWENIHFNKLLRKHHIKNCFVPVYCRPWFNGGIKYISVIHDLEAYHYPQYHPVHEVVYSRIAWYANYKNSQKVIAISNWVKNDILDKYRFRSEDIEVIYNPVTQNRNQMAPFDELHKKYNIIPNEYFYALSQMIPNKNTEMLVHIMSTIIERNEDLPRKLLLSGISGPSTDKLKKLIQEKQLQDYVILTGYVSEGEKNTLYKNARAFLMPSIFEGFGMPPVEALMMKTRVVCTDCASIPEVTQGCADYVKNPYDVDEWIELLQSMPSDISGFDASIYDKKLIASKYMAFLRTQFGE